MGIWYVFYFVITIFFCSFYLLNLVLAVVYLSYEKELQSLEHEVSEIISNNNDFSYHCDVINIHAHNRQGLEADEKQKNRKKRNSFTLGNVKLKINLSSNHHRKVLQEFKTLIYFTLQVPHI